MGFNLRFIAGPKAFARIREKGLYSDDVAVLAGASGAAKWLVLSHLDRAIFSSWLKDRQKPLFLIGTSIGAWRFAALSQDRPATAIAKLESAYINQRYSNNPSPADITRESVRILDCFLDDARIGQVLAHPFCRLRLLAVRCRKMTGSGHSAVLIAGLDMAAVTNAVSRKFLKFFFERILFFDPRDRPPFISMNQFPIHRVALDKYNIKAAILASGSIPLLMQGITNISGAPEGMYRDGGVIDYHLDLPFLQKSDKIVLFPHFKDTVIPGWFDKELFWRKPCRSHMDNVLLVTPSREFIARLPYGRIPDRKDFTRFRGRDDQRIDYWNQVVRMCECLGHEFMETVGAGTIRHRVEPMKGIVL
ncbi:MAG: patatin-like phospholipase family protein [Deltaproteobacteria bacterium]|nr:patatin-like phospholipase family protein [Deltaproteobacteria bacterium]